MPQVIAGAAVAGGAAWFVSGASAFMPVFATTLAAGFVGQLITPEPSLLSNRLPQDRQVSGRSTLASRRYVLGRAQLAAATLAYGEITGDQGEYLHLVMPLCEGPIQAVDDILFDANLVGARDGDGVVIDGVYEKIPDGAGDWNRLARIHVSLGPTDKAADTDLVSESDGRWTSDHRGRGIADLTLRLRRDPKDAAYPSGIPRVRAVVRGVLAYDPRDASNRYTVNSALLVRWLLTLPTPNGFGADTSEIDETMFAAAANICDERVSVDTYTSPAVTADATTDTLTFATRDITIGHGDGVQIASTGTLPGGLSGATTYYAIRPDGMRCQLATSFANAMAGTAINLSSAGTGTITLSHIDQARYTCNGVYSLDQNPRQILTAMLATMGGALWWSEGKFKIRAGAWITPRSMPITAADLSDGEPLMQVRTPRRELFNQIRGTYTDPLQDHQPTDFPAVSDSSYVTEDGGVVLPKDIDFQFCDNPIRAQRLAKMNLRRARQGTVLTLPCKLTVADVGLWDVVPVTISALGLDNDTFRVVGWEFSRAAGYQIILTLQSETSDVFGWSASDAAAATPRPPLILPDANVVSPPSGLVLESGTSHLLQAADGTIISRIHAEWDAAPDPNLGTYEMQWRKDTEIAFESITVPASQLEAYTGPVEDDVEYTVRVRAVRLGSAAKSEWVEDTETVVGKTAAPTAPTSIGITQLANALRITWNASPDADYRQTQLWESASNNRAVGSQLAIVSGAQHLRTGLAAGETRYYWVRHMDTSGNISDWYPASETGGISGTADALELDDDVVDTINIVGNAVTNITSAYTGSTTIISAGTWTQVQSLVVTLGAHPAVVRASCHANTNAGVGNYGSTQIRVLRDGSVIAGPVANTAYTMADGFLGFDINDAPGAGTYTYSIELFPSHGCGVDARYLGVLETKR